MYPETPEYTPKQAKTIKKWLNIAGSKGKGCKRDHITVEVGPGETIWEGLYENMPIITINATNVALEVENNEASHIPSLGKSQKRESNK